MENIFDDMKSFFESDKRLFYNAKLSRVENVDICHYWSKLT